VNCYANKAWIMDRGFSVHEVCSDIRIVVPYF